MVLCGARSPSASDRGKSAGLDPSFARHRKARSANLCRYLDRIAIAGTLDRLSQSPHISHWFRHRSTHNLPNLHRIDSRILAAPVMLHDEAFGAAFCGYHRSRPGRLREGRELERAADLGPLVRWRHSDLVAVDLLSRLIAGADAAAV